MLRIWTRTGGSPSPRRPCLKSPRSKRPRTATLGAGKVATYEEAMLGVIDGLRPPEEEPEAPAPAPAEALGLRRRVVPAAQSDSESDPEEEPPQNEADSLQRELETMTARLKASSLAVHEKLREQSRAMEQLDDATSQNQNAVSKERTALDRDRRREDADALLHCLAALVAVVASFLGTRVFIAVFPIAVSVAARRGATPPRRRRADTQMDLSFCESRTRRGVAPFHEGLAVVCTSDSGRGFQAAHPRGARGIKNGGSLLGIDARALLVARHARRDHERGDRANAPGGSGSRRGAARGRGAGARGPGPRGRGRGPRGRRGGAARATRRSVRGTPRRAQRLVGARRRGGPCRAAAGRRCPRPSRRRRRAMAP